MEDHERCPICMDIPEQEIYQCVGGHTICRTCVVKLTSCPQCREPYGTQKIRNRALEQILDKQTFDCLYVEGGCKEKLKRRDISKHAETCLRRPLYLCKILGFSNCNYVLNSSDRNNVIKHFEEHHFSVQECSNKIVMWHTDFISAVEATKNQTWNPVIMNTDGGWCGDSFFMIVGSVNVTRKSASWMCLQICGTSENTVYEAEFTLLNGEAKLPLFKWSIPVLKVESQAVVDEMKNIPLEIPLSFIKNLCGEMSDIPLSIVVQPSNIIERVESLQNTMEVWTFSSEAKLIGETLGSGSPTQPVHSTVTCNGCRQKPVVGKRHKCLQCADYDLCENCMAEGTHAHHVFVVLATPEQGQLLRRSFPIIRTQIMFGNVMDATSSSVMGVICPNINCDGCLAQSFAGKQYKCLQCPDYDLCEGCMARGRHAFHIFAIVTTFEQRQIIRQSFRLIRLPDNQETSNRDQVIVSVNGTVAQNVICDGCRVRPILGKQYKCLQCPNYDLCTNCLSRGTHSTHMFIMISSKEQRQLIRTHFRQIR